MRLLPWMILFLICAFGSIGRSDDRDGFFKGSTVWIFTIDQKTLEQVISLDSLLLEAFKPSDCVFRLDGQTRAVAICKKPK